MHSVLKNPLQYVHRPLPGNNMTVQVVNRERLENPKFMKLSCHALNETLNSIKEKQ